MLRNITLFLRSETGATVLFYRQGELVEEQVQI
jgi:hypothetical protein